MIGFDSAPIIEPVPAERAVSTATLAAPVKPRRRRAAKPRKRLQSVRVTFDDDEFLKLSMQAEARSMALPEYLRHRAPRSAGGEPPRDRPRLPPHPNVFARLGHFMTGLAGVRWAGHRATPPGQA